MLNRLLVIVSLLWTLSAALPAATPSFTATVTFTRTVTRTRTPTFTATRTQAILSTATVTLTSTISPTRTTTANLPATASPTITTTRTASPTPTISATRTTTPSSTQTAMPPTPTQPTTPAASPTLSPVIDDFEDGNYTGFNGGSSYAAVDSLGASAINLNLAAGSTLSASSFAAHCLGSIGQDMGGGTPYCRVGVGLLPGGVPVDLVQAVPGQAITFSYQAATPGVPLELRLWTASGHYYSYAFTPADANWHTQTAFFPDASGPSPLLLPGPGAPAWSSGGTAIVSVSIDVIPSTSGPQNFEFSIDDLYFGEPASGSSPAQVGTALGVPVAHVRDAYAYELDEQLTWIVLRLARHCGCHPSQIMQMRETRSWGQIALELGTTWATVLAEVDADTAALPQPVIDIERMQRGLLNGPLPPVAVYPYRYYIPVNQFVMPTPSGSCP